MRCFSPSQWCSTRLGQAFGSALAGLFAGDAGKANLGILAAGAASLVAALALFGSLLRPSRLATNSEQQDGRHWADAEGPTP